LTVFVSFTNVSSYRSTHISTALRENLRGFGARSHHSGAVLKAFVFNEDSH